MKKKVAYEPPIIRDLSMQAASGQDEGVRGVCFSGAKPYTACLAGNSPDGATDDCITGDYESSPSCSVGNSAATICISGAAQV